MTLNDQCLKLSNDFVFYQLHFAFLLIYLANLQSVYISVAPSTKLMKVANLIKFKGKIKFNRISTLTQIFRVKSFKSFGHRSRRKYLRCHEYVTDYAIKANLRCQIWSDPLILGSFFQRSDKAFIFWIHSFTMVGSVTLIFRIRRRRARTGWISRGRSYSSREQEKTAR